MAYCPHRHRADGIIDFIDFALRSPLSTACLRSLLLTVDDPLLDLVGRQLLANQSRAPLVLLLPAISGAGGTSARPRPPPPLTLVRFWADAPPAEHGVAAKRGQHSTTQR